MKTCIVFLGAVTSAQALRTANLHVDDVPKVPSKCDLHSTVMDIAEVEFDWSPQNPDELKLVKGTCVVVLEQMVDGWFRGFHKETPEKIGMFPGNHVKRHNNVQMDVAEVEYDWSPQNPDLLKLVKGTYIVVLEKQADGWFRGFDKETPEKIGMFPGNHVKRYNNATLHDVANASIKESTKKEKKQKKQLPKLPSKNNPPATPNMDVAEVEFDWSPQNSDELKLVKGTHVVVLEKMADGWFRGFEKTTPQKIGMFPGNHVKGVIETPIPQQQNERPTEETVDNDKENVESCAMFLSKPEWQNTDEKKAREFLLTKGYAEQEINQAFSKRILHAGCSFTEENVIKMPLRTALIQDATSQSSFCENASETFAAAGSDLLKPFNLNPVNKLKPNGYKVVYAEVRAKKGYEEGKKLGFQCYMPDKVMFSNEECGDTFFDIIAVLDDTWASKYTDLKNYIGHTLCKINDVEFSTKEEWFAAKNSMAEKDDIVFTLRKYMPVRSEKPAKKVEFASCNDVKFIGQTNKIDIDKTIHSIQYCEDDGYAGGSGYSESYPLGYDEERTEKQEMAPPCNAKEKRRKTVTRQLQGVTLNWNLEMSDDDKTTNDDEKGIAFQKQYDAVMTLHEIFDFNIMCPGPFEDFQNLKDKIDEDRSYLLNGDFQKEFQKTIRYSYLDLLMAFEKYVKDNIGVSQTFRSATEMLDWYQNYDWSQD